MATSSLSFEKFVQEAHEYLNELSVRIGEPDNKELALAIWRAVLHTLRDRITISESLHLIAQLPTILKGIYVEGWKYQEKPPHKFSEISEIKDEVEELLHQYSPDTKLSKPTDEVISITIDSLRRYVSEGEMEDIEDQMPKELKELIH